jgi:hypothetical protein
MHRHLVYRFLWRSINVILVLTFVTFVWGSVWEYSTRQYLRGFADAIVPADAPAQQRVEAILAWMTHGPSRHSPQQREGLLARDPRETLNYQQLLNVCGGASNAFVNLAVSSGLQARRLLLLDSHRMATHVVSEVKLDGRWIVVDPAFHFIAQDSSGRLLTRQDLENQEVLREVTSKIPGYLPIYNYSLTVHVRLSRIPVAGRYLRKSLDWIWPGWEDKIDWTLILERDSLALFVVSAFALAFFILARFLMGWYGERKLGITRIHLHHQVWQAGVALIKHPQ